MPVVVLQSAKDDLRDGYLFYERQGGSYLGNYFLATLQGDLASIVPFHADSRIRYTTTSKMARRVFTVCLTTAATRIGFTAIFKWQKHLNRETANERKESHKTVKRSSSFALTGYGG